MINGELIPSLKTNGTVVDLKSLQVEILEVPLSVGPGAYLPTAGNAINWQDITKGHGGRS